MSRDSAVEAAFATMYRETYPHVLAYLRRRVDDGAEDLASEVYAVAWRSWGRVPAEEMRPWLFGVARNVLANGHRATDRRRRLELRVSGERGPVVDDGALADMSIDLRRAWALLDETDREVLSLVSWDGLTSNEAARVLGCSRAAYSMRLTRARRRLRRSLDAVESESVPGLRVVQELRPGTELLPRPGPPRHPEPRQRPEPRPRLDNRSTPALTEGSTP
ncbi:RNA polymerase sigma factor [Oerskovia sp. KBS0722]|uniref:RNA polymerase sigma factor n=1 Tax=Oerskovia sp. KBS0722 TaxID=1179673 RepID=UPI00110DF3F5|nr:sigma-70 family RNA polymerase sigma factor [Oerskovia sp. KBS0722]QDW62236.1 sigma-70 family RNA polymerase sigma factor [Oerskovia sp. KBS0722]